MTAKSKSNIKPEITYDQAMAELQKLVDELLNEQTSIDYLYAHVARANELVQICQEKLRKVDSMIKEIIE
jgi:exodeoxyribonuclease VII small subunit